METHNPTTGQILEAGLGEPFDPLVLHRAMTLFPTALGLKPLKASPPSDDFIANLWSGRRTYLAIIRNGFGRDFKNFQNYALQRVETTPAVRQRLLETLSGSEEMLEFLAKRMREGVLVANLASIARVAEGTIYQVMRGLSSGPQKCPHCQAKLISSPMLWWREQSCDLGEAEFRFVDRLLYEVLAITLLPWLFRPHWTQMKAAAEELAALCNADGHLFKNWLNQVQRGYKAKDLTALATRAGLIGPSPDSHLQRCARGEMLTVDTIQAVTARLPNPKSLRTLGMQSRALAFVVDFIVAADSAKAPLSWAAAQTIVGARLLRLSQDLELRSGMRVRRIPASVTLLA